LDSAGVALAQARSQNEQAQKQLADLQRMGKEQLLKAAEGTKESAEGHYRAATAQLSYSEIRSPIDGVVTDRPLFAGETAPAGTPLITVMETSALIAKLHIAQIQAQQLSIGAPATISVPGLDDPVDAKASLISPALDPGSTTVEVWLRVENPRNILKAGTPVHASITGRTVPNALLVPSEALQTAPDGSRFVMVIGTDNIAHKHPVTIGIQTAKDAQILSGITAKDTVITTGAYALDEGTKVKVGPADGDKLDAGKAGEDK